MRKLTSAFQSGPLLPGGRTLLIGVLSAAVGGWVVLSANGRVPDPAETPAITAPPTVAAHVVAPLGVQEALVNSLERQNVLLESLRARLETRTRELELVRIEITALAARLAMPAHVPTLKPAPGAPLPDPSHLAALQNEQARLEASRGEINRRIASTENYIAEANNLMSFNGTEPQPGS